MNVLLQVEDLVAAHGDAQEEVLRGVSFEAARGSLTALLGPSGCGKSTLVRAVAGLHAPLRGRLVLDGRDITALAPEERPIGVVLQGGAAFPHLDVLGNVMFPLLARGLPAREARAQAHDALARVGLEQRLHEPQSALAGGEQQLLALARALAPAPALLLLDEPLSNVDARQRRALREAIRGVQQRLALTVLYVTHDQAEAIAVSDHLVLIDAGRVVESGPPQQLYAAPHTRFAARFMGDATTLAAERGADGRVRIGELELPRAFPGPVGEVEVAVRPEAWQLAPARLPGLPGRVAKRAFLGRLMEYQVATPQGPVLVHAPYDGLPVECGAPVSLRIVPQGAAWVLPHEAD
jgi:iron(III) transport system ATP-binding protein